MELENGPLEKEIPIRKHHFQVPCWISGVYPPSCTKSLRPLVSTWPPPGKPHVMHHPRPTGIRSWGMNLPNIFEYSRGKICNRYRVHWSVRRIFYIPTCWLIHKVRDVYSRFKSIYHCYLAKIRILIHLTNDWLVLSTQLKSISISQIGNLPQIGMKIKNIWNHHLDNISNICSKLVIIPYNLNFSAHLLWFFSFPRPSKHHLVGGEISPTNAAIKKSWAFLELRQVASASCQVVTEI